MIRLQWHHHGGGGGGNCSFYQFLIMWMQVIATPICAITISVEGAEVEDVQQKLACSKLPHTTAMATGKGSFVQTVVIPSNPEEVEDVKGAIKEAFQSLSYKGACFMKENSEEVFGMLYSLCLLLLRLL
jgi:hypothetical protein